MNPVIVVGTDFSETALHAAREARRLGSALGSTLAVVHVREGLGRAEVPPAPEERCWLEAAGLAPHELHVRSGTPWVELVRITRELEADLIVAGTHGTTGFHPIALGSTAQRLAVLSPRPVVLVGCRDGEPTRVRATPDSSRASRGGSDSTPQGAPR